MSRWWGSRRYGIFVHANVATVPGWSPIGEYAEWYRSHLGEPVADVLLHPTPLVEVLAHHRERWGHVERYDDFVDLLTFDRFDPDEWAALVTDAGAGYTVHVTKHHDGWCWWDAPGGVHRLVDRGPRRDVVAEYAAACGRAGVVYGAYYSLLDWSDPRYPGRDYVDEVLHPHVRDLVERHGARYLWGDGHWGHGPGTWRADDLLTALRSGGSEVLVNDRWWATDPDVTTFEYEVPDQPPSGSWEECRAVGGSFGWNRAERREHHLSGAAIVALVTEVVAKGGHLLLGVGPSADGRIPTEQTEPLLEAGHWIRRHADLVHRGEPWEVWGDDDVRYLRLPDADPSGPAERPNESPAPAPPDRVALVDVHGRGRFRDVRPDRVDVLGVRRRADAADGPAVVVHDWALTDRGLVIGRSSRAGTTTADPTVYEVELVPRPRVADGALRLFAPADPPPLDLAEVLEAARPGSTVELGDGVHRAPPDGVLRVPARVTLRGLGPGRSVLTGTGSTVVVLGAGARLEHLTVRSEVPRTAWFPLPVVEVVGARAALLDADVDGHVVVRSAAHDVRVRACRATGIVTNGADRVEITHCRLRGNRWDVGIDVDGGDGVVVDDCELRDHLAAISVRSATATIIRGNVISARWWGVRLSGTDHARLTGNSVGHTMRAFDVDGGRGATLDGNAVADGDSGCVIQAGASATVLTGNRWERCRIGVLAWDAGPVSLVHNVAVDLHEPDGDIVVGPDDDATDVR